MGRRRGVWLALLGAVVALWLMGCGGGGAAFTPGVMLTLGGDVAARPADAPLTLQAPLDAGASVEVLDFRTGARYAAGVTGANGFCRLPVSAGPTVAMVVTGTRAGKPYRLALLLAISPTVPTTCIMDPATTLAAEAIAARYFRKGTSLDRGTIDGVLAAARAYLATHPTADISLGGGLLSADGAFGEVGVLNAEALASVLDAVPATITNEVVLGKNAAQQLKEGGLRLKAMMTEETPSLQGVADTYTAALAQAKIDALAAKYQGVLSRLSRLLVPALGGDWQYGDKRPSIITLPVNKGYRVTQDATGGLVLADAPALDTAGQITVEYATPAGTHRLVAKQNGYGPWSVTESSTADPQLAYSVSFPDAASILLNPYMKISFRLADGELRVPVTFDGTLYVRGVVTGVYNHAELNGTLTAEEVQVSGKVVVDFLAQVPAGAPDGASIYNYPTGLELSEATVDVMAGPLTVRITGNLTARAELPRGLDLRTRLTSIRLRGGSLVATTAEKKLVVRGDINVGVKYVNMHNKELAVPSTVSLTNVAVTYTAGTDTIELTGGITGACTLVSVGDNAVIVPTAIDLQGTYGNTISGTGFTGTLKVNWENPGNDPTVGHARGTISATGDLTGKDAQTYGLALTAVLDGQGGLQLTLTKLAFGTYNITGTIGATLEGNSLRAAALDLANQDGVTFHMESVNGQAPQGAILTNGTPVAALLMDDVHLRANFTDGTHEYLL